MTFKNIEVHDEVHRRTLKNFWSTLKYFEVHDEVHDEVHWMALKNFYILKYINVIWSTWWRTLKYIKYVEVHDEVHDEVH